ncbi:MAG: sigma-70 family RNA polymerase sigma factor [Nibricoccus sp.]
MASLVRSSPVSTARTGFSLDMADADAVRGVIAGNREMFEVIVRRYNSQLYRVGMAYLRDHAQTEDAMQNAYLKAFLHLRHFRDNAAFATWLTRIMINECLMHLRRKKRFVLETIDDAATRPETALQTEPELDGLGRQEIKALLEQAVQTLPRTHRVVYLLREVQQLSTEETARCLGLSAANVKVSLHRAREGLKTQIMKSAAGVELFDYGAAYCDPMTARVMAAVWSAQPE